MASAFAHMVVPAVTYAALNIQTTLMSRNIYQAECPIPIQEHTLNGE